MAVKTGYPSGLTASAMSMLLHYFWSPSGWPGIEKGEAIRTYAELVDAELMDPRHAKLTDRGLAMARYIMEKIPLPESRTRWEINGVGIKPDSAY